MLARGRGKVIFTASLLSFQGGINVPGYAAAKSGIAGLTRALSNEWTGRGVNVNAIAPGYIATDNTQALQDDPDRSRSIVERIPAGRWGAASDLGWGHGVPRLAGVGLRQRRRAARRRRVAGTMSTMTTQMWDVLARHRVVPVIVAEDHEVAAPLAEALSAAGLPLAEVTFRTPAAEQVLRRMAADPAMVVGAGTVLTPEQVDRAVDAGARFIVSPGISRAVVARALELDVPVLPGCRDAVGPDGWRSSWACSGEVLPGRDAGWHRCAQGDGRARSPACGSSRPAASPPRRCPTTSRCPAVSAVGGTWIAPPTLLAQQRFSEIHQLAAAAVVDR